MSIHRDNPAFETFHGPEFSFALRIANKLTLSLYRQTRRERKQYELNIHLWQDFKHRTVFYFTKSSITAPSLACKTDTAQRALALRSAESDLWETRQRTIWKDQALGYPGSLYAISKLAPGSLSFAKNKLRQPFRQLVKERVSSLLNPSDVFLVWYPASAGSWSRPQRTLLYVYTVDSLSLNI